MKRSDQHPNEHVAAQMFDILNENDDLDVMTTPSTDVKIRVE